MLNFGITLSPNTWPIFSFISRFVITEPPFISLPVPAIVSTQPTGRISQSGSSYRIKYLSHGSSLQLTETDTAFA